VPEILNELGATTYNKGSAFSEDDDKAPDSHPFIVRLLLSGMQNVRRSFEAALLALKK
jgi:hypothetical protein